MNMHDNALFSLTFYHKNQQRICKKLRWRKELRTLSFVKSFDKAPRQLKAVPTSYSGLDYIDLSEAQFTMHKA